MEIEFCGRETIRVSEVTGNIDRGQPSGAGADGTTEMRSRIIYSSFALLSVNVEVRMKIRLKPKKEIRISEETVNCSARRRGGCFRVRARSGGGGFNFSARRNCERGLIAGTERCGQRPEQPLAFSARIRRPLLTFAEPTNADLIQAKSYRQIRMEAFRFAASVCGCERSRTTRDDVIRIAAGNGRPAIITNEANRTLVLSSVHSFSHM